MFTLQAKYLYRFLIIFCLLYIFMMSFVIFGGAKDHLFKADLMVVLGTKIEADGTPSLGLKARLDKAAVLYQQGFAPRILVSGGTGKEGYDEAKVMSAYLKTKAIPESAIIEDNKGENTRATAKNSLEYMKINHLQSVILVSQYYHLPRAALAFKEVGIQQIGQASPAYTSWRDFVSVPREFLAYPAYFLGIR